MSTKKPRTDNHANNAYLHLRNKLVAGEFEPGARILYGPVGKEIGVSATPVREAAGRLANEGLLDLVPNMGAIVRKLDRKALIEVYEVREIFEPHASALAAERATTEEIKKLSAELKKMTQIQSRYKGDILQFAERPDARQFDRADYEFHMLILNATGNDTLIRTASQSQALTRVFGIRPHRYDFQVMKRACDDHAKILDAIIVRDAPAASAAAAEHIRNGLAGSLREYEANDGESIAKSQSPSKK